MSSLRWVGWPQALALASLLTMAITANGATRVAATTMARHLDMTLLAPLANASAFTGLLLAAATAWGLFRYWWVPVFSVAALIVVLIHRVRVTRDNAPGAAKVTTACEAASAR